MEWNRKCQKQNISVGHVNPTLEKPGSTVTNRVLMISSISNAKGYVLVRDDENIIVPFRAALNGMEQTMSILRKMRQQCLPNRLLNKDQTITDYRGCTSTLMGGRGFRGCAFWDTWAASFLQCGIYSHRCLALVNERKRIDNERDRQRPGCGRSAYRLNGHARDGEPD